MSDIFTGLATVAQVFAWGALDFALLGLMVMAIFVLVIRWPR